MGLEKRIHTFFLEFMKRLGQQVEMGQAATDSGYVAFQKSVSANVEGRVKLRQEILLRKLFQMAPDVADAFDPSVIAESGIAARLNAVNDSIVSLVDQLNKRHAGSTGEDLFKATNKTTQAFLRVRKPVSGLDKYKDLIDDLYFLFRESVGSRLADWPDSFKHVNELRTDVRHDVDHGDESKARSKRRRAGTTFSLYAGNGTPDTVEAKKLALAQTNLLTAIEAGISTNLIDFETVPTGEYSTASGLTVNGINFVGPFSPYLLRVFPESGWGEHCAQGTGNTLAGVGEIDIKLPPDIRAFGANVGPSFCLGYRGQFRSRVPTVNRQAGVYSDKSISAVSVFWVCF